MISPSRKKPILIVSSSLDEKVVEAIRKIVDREGYPLVFYNIEKVFKGEDVFFFKFNEQNGRLSINYNKIAISPSDISSAWFRKMNGFRIKGAEEDIAKQLYINNEVVRLHQTIWPLYPDKLWLNSPNNILNADRKIYQLQIAKKVGFIVPRTIITNSWSFIESELLVDNNLLVVKMARGVISEKNKVKAMYTTQLNHKILRELKDRTIPFPGIYQPYFEKRREWRVTVVGKKVFAIAIYTDKAAKDDWRKHQLTKSVVFKYETLPSKINERCIDYLKQMKLKYGAFDFIETPSGEFVFLECNPNGEYGWLEDKLGIPISETIASELIRIANNNS